MTPWIYFTLWLFAALVMIAFISAGVAKHMRMREVRKQQGWLLMDALDRYSEWFAAQRHAVVFEGESDDAAEALDDASILRMEWFPELAPDFAALMAVHSRLLSFLAVQHALRQRDPDAWLETDHDGRFLALWRLHAVAVQSMQQKLVDTVGGPQVPAAASHPPVARAAETPKEKGPAMSQP